MEDNLSSIEEKYTRTLELFEYIESNPSFADMKKKSEAIKAALAFQRNIELLFEDVRKLSDDKTRFYIERCGTNIYRIREYLISSRTLGACEKVDRGNFSDAYSMVEKIRSYMYQFLDDVRLIYALRIYPIEEKMALKSALTDLGFAEATKALEEAETNLAEKHLKDCIDRCREALEKTAASILAAEKKTPSGYFSTDMGTLSGLGIIGKEPKRLMTATYSYLSEVGAHGRGGKLTLGDAHYAMKETYMRIDILLKRYSENLKK